jgi:DNA-binding NtrC family response regulator
LGHERGRFTVATAMRPGWFERADGGSLFLDDAAELTPALRVRLLRILRARSVSARGLVRGDAQ